MRLSVRRIKADFLRALTRYEAFERISFSLSMCFVRKWGNNLLLVLLQLQALRYNIHQLSRCQLLQHRINFNTGGWKRVAGHYDTPYRCLHDPVSSTAGGSLCRGDVSLCKGYHGYGSQILSDPICSYSPSNNNFPFVGYFPG